MSISTSKITASPNVATPDSQNVIQEVIRSAADRVTGLAHGVRQGVEWLTSKPAEYLGLKNRASVSRALLGAGLVAGALALPSAANAQIPGEGIDFFGTPRPTGGGGQGGGGAKEKFSNETVMSAIEAQMIGRGDTVLYTNPTNTCAILLGKSYPKLQRSIPLMAANKPPFPPEGPDGVSDTDDDLQSIDTRDLFSQPPSSAPAGADGGVEKKDAGLRDDPKTDCVVAYQVQLADASKSTDQKPPVTTQAATRAVLDACGANDLANVNKALNTVIGIPTQDLPSVGGPQALSVGCEWKDTADLTRFQKRGEKGELFTGADADEIRATELDEKGVRVTTVLDVGSNGNKGTGTPEGGGKSSLEKAAQYFGVLGAGLLFILKYGLFLAPSALNALGSVRLFRRGGIPSRVASVSTALAIPGLSYIVWDNPALAGVLTTLLAGANLTPTIARALLRRRASVPGNESPDDNIPEPPSPRPTTLPLNDPEPTGDLGDT